jgi:small nuclear ribonucleoprotein G
MSENNKTLPDLKKYLDKRVLVRMHGNRKVTGVLQGYDHFMNVVIANGTEEHYDGTSTALGETVVRGNTVVNLELLQAE